MIRVQVRFCVWLPVQLIGNLIAVAALPRMGELFEAAGAAPAASVVAWGAAYHLTLGLLLPGALRCHFPVMSYVLLPFRRPVVHVEARLQSCSSRARRKLPSCCGLACPRLCHCATAVAAANLVSWCMPASP